MNQLLQTQSTDEKELLVYYYRKIQDVDEVILQLLNEAGMDGFIKSSVNKAESTINYNITGYKKWADIAAGGITAGRLASALEDLYRLLASLEDSFIDIEYVLLDTDYMFIHPETGKVQLVVVPCQTIVNEGYTLTDCVDKMFEGFSSNQSGEKAEQLHAKMHRGVRSLRDLKEIAEILHAFEDEEENGVEEPEVSFDLMDDFEEENNSADFVDSQNPIEPEPVAEIDMGAEFLDLSENAEEPTEEEPVADKQPMPEETAVLEEIVRDAEKIKNDGADLASDAEYMRQQLREEIRHELEAELTDKIKQNLQVEVENELREKIWAELSETFTQNMRHDVENELREKIQAELEEKYQEKEAAKEAAEEDEKVPYLIRKKTGEIIQLNKHTFIIGKLDTCCDYVIRGNNAISRLHAVIKYREDTDSYFIVDCNSTNHTYLNGRRIEAEQPAELKDGMHIHLALEEFVFQLR